MNQRHNGALLSYLLILVRIGTTFLFTPFLVSSLGTAGYGLFSLVGAMAAYLYILDFGMNDAVLRFLVAHENDHRARDAFLGRMLGLYALIGLLVGAVTFGFSVLASPIFGAKIAPDQLEMLRTMLVLTGLGAAVIVLLNPIGALLSAKEAFVFLRGLEIAVTILSTLAMVAVLKAGYGPVEVVMVTVGFTVLQALLRLLYAVVRVGLRIRIGLPDPRELRRVGGYAGPIFVSMIAEVIFWKFDSILIGALLGASAIAAYAIGVTFNKYFMSFATAISRIMTPEIVRLVDRGADPRTLTDLMIRISRVQALVILLILGGLIVFGRRFLALWLGSEFSVSYWVMLSVLIPYALELTGNARNIVLQVRELYWIKSAITLGMAAINIPLTIVLLKVWGVTGAAVSTGLAVLAGYLAIAVLLSRRVGIGMVRYFLETGRGIVPVFVVLIATGLVAERFLPAGWIGLFAGSALFAVVYTTAMLTLAAKPAEKALFSRVIFSVLRKAKGRT